MFLFLSSLCFFPFFFRPKLLFLDEPTSGLDSVTALSLCYTLKDLSSSGECTVVCTIHQPQSKIFALFDDLIILKNGYIVYSGNAAEVIPFYTKAGFPLPGNTKKKNEKKKIEKKKT